MTSINIYHPVCINDSLTIFYAYCKNCNDVFARLIVGYIDRSSGSYKHFYAPGRSIDFKIKPCKNCGSDDLWILKPL